MTPRFFTWFILVNILKILTNLFLTLIRFLRKTSAIAAATLDQGDREYYCHTMLTLFKPWRTGKDLKYEIQTWDESFLKYEFSKRQLEIMKYFNVRYECLDARDDYSI